MFTFFQLNWRDWSVIQTTTFSDSLFPIAPNSFLLYLSFFRAFFPKECTIVVVLYPVWQNKIGMMVDFLIVWSLHSSLLYESSSGMSLDTISSSSSDSAANCFNFWSKVGIFYVMFSLHALLEFNLASLDVVVDEHSVNPTFFSSCCFWRVLQDLLCSLSFPCYFILTFSQLWFFSRFCRQGCFCLFHCTKRFQ